MSQLHSFLSSQDEEAVVNAIKEAEIIENFICGNVISRNARKRVAPRERATFSWFMS